MKTKLRILAISMGIIYFIFGMLKFFPHLSPAEEIGINTVQALTFNVFSGNLAIFSLAIFEVVIGLLLISQKFLKIAIIAALAHMVCTFAPMLFFPEEFFATSYYTPSLLGQYILKNIIIISALFVIYPTKNEDSDQLVSSFTHKK